MNRNKKYFSLAFYLIAFAVYFSSCDKVKNPYVQTNNSSAGCPNPVFVSHTVMQKVLIEDYTGHRCIQCPPAGTTLENIRDSFPQQVIGIGIHANYWAEPSPCMNQPSGVPTYAYEHYLGCTAAENYFTAFNFQSNPNGMVNRVYVSGSQVVGYSQWYSIADTLVKKTPSADINIFTNYDAASHKLCVSCRTIFLKPMSGTFNLSVLFVEDSVIDWQSFPGNVNDSTYIFRSVLRDDINGAGTGFGEQIAKGNIAANDTLVKSYSYVVPAGYSVNSPLCTGKPTVLASPCNYTHCYMLAFIFDGDAVSPTYRQIVQVEMKKISP